MFGCSLQICIRASRSAKVYNNQLSTSAQQSLLLLDWTTFFDQLIGHPHNIIGPEDDQLIGRNMWSNLAVIKIVVLTW